MRKAPHNFRDGDVVSQIGYAGVFTVAGSWRGYLRLVSPNGTEHKADAAELELVEQTGDADQGTLLLVTTSHPSLGDHADETGRVHPNLGRLIQPRHYPRIADTSLAGIPWAADNDCFQGLDPVAYTKMLDRISGLEGCRFVTVPDVVGDARETARLFDVWAPAVERRGLPVALVAQDGLEEMSSWLSFQMHRLDALFIGGSTEWKEGPYAAALAKQAARAGKWVHWGRVNTRRRFDLIVATGAASSFDGSKFARFRKTYLDGGLEWARETAGRDSLAAAA